MTPTTQTCLTKTSLHQVAGSAVAVGIAARGWGHSVYCQAFQWQDPEEVVGSHIETDGHMQIEDGQSWGGLSRDMQIEGRLDWQANQGERHAETQGAFQVSSDHDLERSEIDRPDWKS